MKNEWVICGNLLGGDKKLVKMHVKFLEIWHCMNLTLSPKFSIHHFYNYRKVTSWKLRFLSSRRSRKRNTICFIEGVGIFKICMENSYLTISVK